MYVYVFIYCQLATDHSRKLCDKSFRSTLEISIDLTIYFMFLEWTLVITEWNENNESSKSIVLPVHHHSFNVKSIYFIYVLCCLCNILCYKRWSPFV